MKRILYSALIIAILVASAAFVRAQASGELSFGGIRWYTQPCTCSGPILLVSVYDFKLKQNINISYIPGASFVYMMYNLWTSTYLLGTYRPGVAACYMVVGNSCVPSASIGFPEWGMIGNVPGAGTSGN